jgi:tubulin polyglutamylase TTLL6/13
LIVKPEAAC